MNQQTKPNKQWIKIFLLTLAAVMVLGLGGFGWQAYASETTAAATPTPEGNGIKYSTVRRSNLAETISGSGSITVTGSVDLGFGTAGEVEQVNVQPGVVVKEGQMLAVLANRSELEQAVRDAELAVIEKQQAYDDLQNESAGAIAQAEANVATAKENLADALANLRQKGDARCAPSKTQEYYDAYLTAQKRVDEWEGYLNNPNTGYGRDYILEKLAPMRKERNQAWTNMTYCQGYTEEEIAEAAANLQAAQAALAEAESKVEIFQLNAGLDPQAVGVAQKELDNANLQLQQAQDALAGATIIAPVDGTVMLVSAGVGESVQPGVFITLANLEEPRLTIYVDETDLTNIAVGCPVNITFNSLAGQVFTGIVSKVAPKIASINSVPMVQAQVTLDKVNQAVPVSLPPGLAAAVEVTCSQAEDALTVPAQAVYQPQEGLAFVYVLNAQGRSEKREIEIGIQTAALVEVRSGLQEGEKVITSTVAGE